MGISDDSSGAIYVLALGEGGGYLCEQ
jgi:hypothetical protein